MALTYMRDSRLVYKIPSANQLCGSSASMLSAFWMAPARTALDQVVWLWT